MIIRTRVGEMVRTSMKYLKPAKIRFKSTVIFTTLVLLTLSGIAHSVPSKWEKVDASMSELINSGWQITAHGTNRVAANSNTGNGFDVSTFSFLLVKNSSYILCIFDNPKPPLASSVSCRKLN
jgi:hypothetical protein